MKLDLLDREDEDSVEYSMKSTWFFNPKKSKGLTGDEDMVFPHLMILGMAMMTLRDKPAAMPIVGTYIRCHYFLSMSCIDCGHVSAAYRVDRSARTIIMHAGRFKVGREKDTFLYIMHMCIFVKGVHLYKTPIVSYLCYICI